MDPQDPELDTILDRARRAIPGCVAMGCIDTRLGLLLCVNAEVEAAHDQMEVVTAAMAELFRSSNAQAIDSVFRRVSGRPIQDEPELQQVFALSGSYIYVYQSISTAAGLVLATVCGGSANLGMVLARARGTLSELQALVAPTGGAPS